MSTEQPREFKASFERWAGRVRRRLLIRNVLTGAALGLVAGGVAAAILWYLRLGTLRPWTAALGIVGAVAGWVVAMRAKWSNGDVALYLDARLDAKESISTAVQLDATDGVAEPARKAIVQRAMEALGGATDKAVRPRIWDRRHGLLPVGGAAVLGMSLVALPPLPPEPPAPPGVEQVQVDKLDGLEKIIALENLKAKDPEQRKRLKKIAERAKKLRKQLKQGMEKREALSTIAKLRDDIQAERLNFGDKKNRAGLDAAVGQLGKSAKTKKAAKALSNGDLTKFDEEMKKLANLKEKEARDAAKEAIKEAEKAARAKGAKGLADELKRQGELFEKREAKAEALRELAKGLDGKLSDQAKKDLEEFGETGSPEAQKRLAESMNKALEGLSDAERKRLKEQLKEQLEKSQGDANPMTKKQIEDMAKQLSSPEGQKQLEQMLKEMAKPESSDSSKQQQGLDGADKGGAQAQKQLGAPVPMQTPGTAGNAPGKSPGKGKGKGKGNKGKPGGGGAGDDKGTGDHKGSTPKIGGRELRSKANPKMLGGPMHGSTQGRTSGGEGETANQRGTGALGQVGPDEVGGVERSEVPEEYREQVGRYFEP